MLFYSFEFLYLFLPIVLIGYYIATNFGHTQLALVYLVLCSLFFYGWWQYQYVALIIISTLFNYSCGMKLRENSSRPLLIGAVVANLAAIAYFKYAGFLVFNFSQLSGVGLPVPSIVLPLAISFFTFQQIAWLHDNYTGTIDRNEAGFTKYCLFVLFFPQLIAGPIVHHSEMMPQFSKDRQTKFNPNAFSAGLVIFIIGLAKKVLIADNLAPVANHTFDLALQADQIISTAEAWTGSLAYTMQLYFDFSGYADMAIGIALLFNIRLPLNFNSPYKSLSISDFWRRWHMTLSRFLRDYVYIQLGGNRQGTARRYQALLATMILGGLWHGASWTFVFWGALHGVYLVINHIWRRYSRLRLAPIVAWLFTFLAVVVAWVFFRAETFSSALAIVESLVMFEGSTKALDYDSIKTLCFLFSTILICLVLPNTQQLISKKISPMSIYEETTPFSSTSILGKINSRSLGWNISSLCYVAILAIASMTFLLDTTTVNEFIYFQF